MVESADISLVEFAVLCRSLDLVLSPEEADRLREAYIGIKALIRRIPRDETFLSEPAMVYADPGTRLRR